MIIKKKLENINGLETRPNLDFKHKLNNFFKKALNTSKKIISNKRFKKISLIVLLVLLSFLGGILFDSSILKTSNNLNANVLTPTKSLNLTKQVIRGEISSINLPRIVVNANTGENINLELESESIILSSKSKSISGNELKVGDSVLIYASRGTGEVLTIDRIRVVQ